MGPRPLRQADVYANVRRAGGTEVSTEAPVTFPVFMTVSELREVASLGLSPNLWHKFNDAIAIMETGENCCEEMIDNTVRAW